MCTIILNSFLLYEQRELATQTFDVIKDLTTHLEQEQFPVIRPLLCIGGVPMKDQIDRLRRYE